MRHAKALKLVVGVGLALLIACADSADATSGFDRGTSPKAGGGADGGGSDGTKGVNDQTPSAGAAQGKPASDGVLIVHAASFNSFRLCFANRPADLPQPDATVMPESNIVGVEIGSIVRINKLDLVDGKPPGKVYVVREQRIRDVSGTDAKTCGELIVEGNISQSLLKPGDYLPAGELKDPVGVNQADVLAVTGCGTKDQLRDLDNTFTPDVTRCGTPYEGADGNLLATVIPLETSFQKPTDTEIPVQLYNIAPAITALGGTVSVSFGTPNQADGKDLGIKTDFKAGDQLTIDVKQNESTTYGKLGFNVKVDNLKSGAVTVAQTLADVQSLSSPGDTPTSYYYAASNYALLLLGDPSHTATIGGAPNPIYNPRRALHFLAVPVLDPTKDAGAPPADASTPPADGGITTGSK